MLQVPLGQQPNKVLWLLVRSNQSVCNDVFHLKLHFTVHHLGWLGLMSGPSGYLGREGVIWLQVFHILKQGEQDEGCQGSPLGQCWVQG